MAGYLYRNPLDDTVEFHVFPEGAAAAVKPRTFDVVEFDGDAVTLTRCWYIYGSVLNRSQTADLSYTLSGTAEVVLCAKIDTTAMTVALDVSPDTSPSATEFVHIPLYVLAKTSGKWRVTCDLRPGIISIYN